MQRIEAADSLYISIYKDVWEIPLIHSFFGSPSRQVLL